MEALFLIGLGILIVLAMSDILGLNKIGRLISLVIYLLLCFLIHC